MLILTEMGLFYNTSDCFFHSNYYVQRYHISIKMGKYIIKDQLSTASNLYSIKYNKCTKLLYHLWGMQR